MSVVAALTSFVLGMAMLKRINWGRWLYLVTTPLFMILSSLLDYTTDSSPFSLIFEKLIFFGYFAGGVFYLVVLYFLFRPKATAYFKNRDGEPETSDVSQPASELLSGQPHRKIGVGRRVAAVITFCLSVPILGGIGIGIMMIFSLGEMTSAGLITMLLFLLVGVGFFAGGLTLWDWRRWRGVSGTVMCVLGTYMLIGAAGLGIFVPALSDMVDGSLPDFGLASVASAITSVIIIGLGVLALVFQHRRDKYIG
ncbi:hypothetical protein ACFLVW_05290 [Chloroflexota bacterium]